MIIVITTGEALSAGGQFGIGGWTPVLALVVDGNRVVQQVVDFTGGSGVKPDVGLFVGADGLVADIADAVNVRGSAGAGTPGANAWTAIEAIVIDGNRRVKQVVDWVGGSGVKPDVGMYIGPLGYVALVSQATDVRGPIGAPLKWGDIDGDIADQEDLNQTFATAAQGVKADNAVQPSVLDAAIATRATSAQGAKADSALQPAAIIDMAVNPIKVTGNFQYGQVLTASLQVGWAATSYQWTRDGVDIAGATSSTYTLVAADIGKLIKPRGIGLAYTGQNSSAVTYSGPALLRYATAFNKFPNAVVQPAGSDKRLAGRCLRPIGSAHHKSLRVRADACMLQMSDQIYDTVTPMKVIGLYLECNGVSVPVNWSGVAAPTFAAGAYDQLSDTLLPSQFGLTRFSRNTVMYMRGEISVGSGGRLPTTEGIETGSTGVYYNAADSTLTNLSGTGALTFTGTGRTSTGELPFIIVGEQEDIVADARTWLFDFDSIGAQGGDWSYPQQALRGDASAYIAGCACAKVGGTFSKIIYAANQIGSLMKYANGLVEEMHTNSIGQPLNDLKSYSQQVWTFWRSKVSTHAFSRSLRVVRVPLGVKTTGSFSNLAGQTIDGVAWNAGGTVELLNDWYATRVGQPGEIDYFASNLWESPQLVRGANTGKGTLDSAWYKWNVPGYTGDGLHPSNVGANYATGLGANLRAHLLHASNI